MKFTKPTSLARVFNFHVPYIMSMRYFFNKMDNGVDLDMVGTECENLHAARREAILFAAESIRENPEFLWHAGELRIEVVNERHLLVTTIVIQSIDATDPVSIMERRR